MANSRIMLTCKHCGGQIVLAKGDIGHYYTSEEIYPALVDFFEKHEYGKCLGENADEICFSDDAKDHFVILDKGDKFKIRGD